ncbi:hypothetical protein BSKO_08160 [Bryopsis sp. KO-2023]|nr:hypothetical protein BSKO_08160 [Bryopsis sp. KO-2023]
MQVAGTSSIAPMLRHRTCCVAASTRPRPFRSPVEFRVNQCSTLRGSALRSSRPAFSQKSFRRREICVAPKAIFDNLAKVFNTDPREKTRQAFQSKVDSINALEPGMQALSDEELRAKTVELKEKLGNGKTVEEILPEAFAVAREASWRVLGLRPFDVQLIGGMLLHEGKIAEMGTGEGKTLVSVLPAYLNALTGKGVHIVTVNDYLARRDSEWVGQVHRFLGLGVGLIQMDMEPPRRRAAYEQDVTYVTNSELGFDYLRDNLASTPEELVLKDFNFCIIDEVDSILIDEARTPLIISGSADKPSDQYYKAAQIAGAMTRDVHYTVDEKQKNVLLTEEGYEAAEDILEVSDLYDPRQQWASYVINAIKAKELQIRDVNYIVRGKEVIIVDEFTGRSMPGRRWSDGLHQAVEAKEKLEIQAETVTLASISYQNFFRTFPKLAGMTGTAATEVAEFQNIYDLNVSVVPTNKTSLRQDNPDVVFRVEGGKWAAVVTEIKRMNKKGRPVLVGTTSVEKSEELSEMLTEAGIKHQVLNAKPENVERESEIVAQSGRKGAVTIATNMAGRGTDILLGGNPEYMARLKLREMLMPKVVSLVDDDSVTPAAMMALKQRSWQVAPDLFPCELPEAIETLAKEAVAGAVESWGERTLTALEAEERLSIACEKAPTEDPVTAKIREVFQKTAAEFKVYAEEEKKEVVALGGLHVVGTERHESRRVDNQLRGRGGRQGDPGSTRFFLSLEDSLFRVFGGDKIKGMMTAFNVGDLPIESQMLTDSLDEAQKKVESYFFDIRRNLFEYDQVLNTQRDNIYSERRQALLSTELTTVMHDYAIKTVDDILEANIDPAIPPEEWIPLLDGLADKMKQYCYMLADMDGALLTKESDGDYEQLREYLRKRGVQAYDDKKVIMEEIQPGLMHQIERFFVLSQTDNLFKEHLQAIKFLQQAVGLRGYAQRDPLTEFKLEAYNLFIDMQARKRRNVIYNVYVFQPAKVTPEDDGKSEEGKNGSKKNSRKKNKSKKAAKAKAK